jgi:AcrR family transcriptional regulator
MSRSAKKTRPNTAERKQELVEFAFQLIARKGLEGLRTRDVAIAAGIDTGTLHYHFPSKELLIQAVVDRMAEDFRRNRVGRAATPQNALDELRNEIFDAATRVRKSPEQLRVFMELMVRASRDKAIAAILARMQASWTAHLTALFTRGVEQKLFRPEINPEIAALVVRAQLLGMSVVGMGAPGQVPSLAEALFAAMQKWLEYDIDRD